MLHWITLSHPLDWIVRSSLSNFSTIPVFSLIFVSSVAHPQLLCSDILWIILPSTAVVQTSVHRKYLRLPSPFSLANVALLLEDGKHPVSASYSWFRSSKFNNCEFHKSSHLNKMFQHSYFQYVALRGMSQLVVFSHFIISTDLYFSSQVCMSQYRTCWLLWVPVYAYPAFWVPLQGDETSLI